MPDSQDLIMPPPDGLVFMMKAQRREYEAGM